MAYLSALWEGLLENEAKREGSRAGRCNGKTDSQGCIFEPLDPAVPEAEYPWNFQKLCQFELIFSPLANKKTPGSEPSGWETEMEKLRWDPFLQARPTDLDSLALLVGERFSKAVPLFWGEEVVKEFPESEVLPLWRSRLLLSSPPGLSFCPPDLLEPSCVEGGEEVSLPESYSWERPREVARGLAVLVKRSAADPAPGI